MSRAPLFPRWKCIPVSVDLSNWESQSRKGLLEMVLLGLLRDGERYGYDLVRGVQELLQQRVVEGSIYPVLARLERDGLVVTEWRVGEAAQPRKYYRMTPAGEAAFEAMSQAWRALATRVVPWLEASDGQG